MENSHSDAAPRESARRVALASMIGTSIEWYDFFVFGTASALVFGRLFFPTFSELAGTLAAFASFAVGFVARPVGGLVFGHIGDRIGRKTTLVVTLTLMGVATFLMGLMPTYAVIGVWAPISMVLLRFVQGLAVGGEWGGAVLMATEHSDRKRRGFFGSFAQVGSALLVLDGAYLVGTEPPVFRRIDPPRQEELQSLVERLANRIGRALERQGVLCRDAESSYLDLAAEPGGAMDDLFGHSITYRVAVGPRAGQKVFSLQTGPARANEPRKGVAQYAGFSLHAGIGVQAEQREKLERLARYVSRSPVALERLDLTAQGQVRYRLKTPYRNGMTHIVLEPLDFIARLAALVPPPRSHQTRFHGVFAAHAALRAAITPGGRGPGAQKEAAAPKRPMPQDVRMNWARRLKRVFGIEIERCMRCGGRLKVIASIEEPELIERILAHRRERGEEVAPTAVLGARAPPQASLF